MKCAFPPAATALLLAAVAPLVAAKTCQMSAAECTGLVLKGTPVPVRDAKGAALVGVPPITADEAWHNMLMEAGIEANISVVGRQISGRYVDNKWLAPCKSAGMCEYCPKFLSKMQVASPSINFHTILRWKRDPLFPQRYLSPKYTRHVLDRPDLVAGMIDNVTNVTKDLSSLMSKCQESVGRYVTNNCWGGGVSLNSYKADCYNCKPGPAFKTFQDQYQYSSSSSDQQRAQLKCPIGGKACPIGGKFQFTIDTSGWGDYLGCTNFIVGYSEHVCKVAIDGRAATCRDMFTGNQAGTMGATRPLKSGDAVVRSADAAAHTKRFVDAAITSNTSNFCSCAARKLLCISWPEAID
eukprot:COSAG01_NODE_7069_length_3368_cov_4.549709_2_plen_353_part_00